MQKIEKANLRELSILFIVMLTAFCLNKNYNYISAFLLIIYGFSIYCLKIYTNKNLFDFQGLLVAGWICPMGLSLFRISLYQKPWQNLTWICFFLFVSCFIIGYSLREESFNVLQRKIYSNKLNNFFNKDPHAEIMFWAGLIIFFFAFVTFLAKWYAAGYFPMISSSYSAYADFISSRKYMNIGRTLEFIPWISLIYKIILSKGWLFFFQLWLVPSLMLLYAINFTDSKLRKIISVIIALFAIILSILAVSRELFLMEMIVIAVVGYFTLGKKLWVVILVFLLTLSGYYVISQARNINDEDLNQIMYITENPNYTANEKINSNDFKKRKQLPGIIVWAYSYFTVGYDNINYLISKLDHYYYGAAQLNPIFVVTGPQWVRNLPNKINVNKYRVAPGLTTYTFMKDAYVDFGMMGVAISMFLWGLLFGLISELYLHYKEPLSLILYGSVAHHLILASFVSWMSHFSYLVSWGILFLLFLFIYKKEIKTLSKDKVVNH